MGADRYVVYGPPPGEPLGDLGRWCWHRPEYVPQIVVDPAAFTDRPHRLARDAGAETVRIELPPLPGDLMGDSVRQTDLAACTLEHLLGQACDGFVMNHAPFELALDPTVMFGETCGGYHLVRSDPASADDVVEQRRVRSAPVIRIAPGVAVCK
jgi:hypothetical protein